MRSSEFEGVLNEKSYARESGHNILELILQYMKSSKKKPQNHAKIVKKQ